MAQLQIEVDPDKGEILGEVPPELEAIFKRIAADAKNTGKGEGIEQAAKEAQKQIEETVKYQLAQRERQLPFDQQRFKQLEEDNSTLASKLSETAQEAERARKLMDEQHAKDILDRTKRIEEQSQRIRELTGQQIRSLAAQAGAMDQSLEVIELWLMTKDVAFDENMVPYVKDVDGQPKQSQGKPVTLEAHVRDYVSKNPQFRNATRGTGRDPHGRSATLTQTQVGGTDLDAARERVANGDRSAQAINEFFEANRARQQG